MKTLLHGGDIYSHENNEIKPIDFSANINPYGLPKAVEDEIIASIPLCINYPDPLCRKLTAAIARFENIPEEKIICGNGAADVIFRIIYGLKPKKALLLAPTFAEYQLALENVGCEIVYHDLEEKDNFQLEEDIIPKIKNVDIAFICNPNNPTGTVADKVLISKIITEADQYHVHIVMDECFMDFIKQGECLSAKEHILTANNLIILKAFTKMYAMAGIRLGYGLVSNERTYDKIYHAGQPWSVSVIAQNSGVIALEQTEYVRKTLVLIEEQREILVKGLEELGLKVYPGRANFILFKSEELELDQKLLAFGILIRNCENYRGLGKGFYRIAVKNAPDNLVLLKSLCTLL